MLFTCRKRLEAVRKQHTVLNQQLEGQFDHLDSLEAKVGTTVPEGGPKETATCHTAVLHPHVKITSNGHHMMRIVQEPSHCLWPVAKLCVCQPKLQPALTPAC